MLYFLSVQVCEGRRWVRATSIRCVRSRNRFVHNRNCCERSLYRFTHHVLRITVSQPIARHPYFHSRSPFMPARHDSGTFMAATTARVVINRFTIAAEFGRLRIRLSTKKSLGGFFTLRLDK